MFKFDTQDLITVSDSPRRLIVLVPADLVDASGFAQKIHWLAMQQKRDVLYLNLVLQEEDYLASTRLLTTLKAITHDSWFKVGSAMVEAANWVDALRLFSQPGDMIVCHKEQTAPAGIFRRLPLGESIETELKLPVHILSGYYRPEPAHIPRWLRGLIFWLGCLAILVGFSVIEFRMDIQAVGAAKQIVLIVLLVIEFGLIYEWNEIVG